MSREDRLAFFAEGLPLILASARGLWDAAQRLKGRRREADVLAGLAKEEAAKILIVMDIVRCPPNRVDGRIGAMLKWFYSHIARLLYAEAAHWNAVDLVELKRYIDRDRRAHYVDGAMGEYIFPNSSIYDRERRLYVDVAAEEDGVPYWSAPTGTDRLFPLIEPPALRAVNALSVIGAFSKEGLKIVGDVWGSLDFVVKERPPDAQSQQFAVSNQLIRSMLERLIEAGLPEEQATKKHVDTVYDSWQMPMYNLDFNFIVVPLEQLEAEREAILRAEMGDSNYY